MSVAVPSGKEIWSAEPLGNLCDIIIGRTPSRNRQLYWKGDLPWLSIADMNQGRTILRTKECITLAGANDSGSRLIRSGTVLLSFKLSIGKVAVSAIDTFTNEAIAALPILNPNKLNKNFLFWTLRSIRLDDEVDAAAKGKTLNKAKLERLTIPLPPLDEQIRIAALLDKVDALRSQRQEFLDLTEKFIQSVFIDMFVQNSGAASWKSQTIAWMSKQEKGAMRTGPFGSQLLHSEFVEQGIAVLGIDNAVKNRFEWGQPRFITQKKYQELKRYKVFPGDVIITIMGTLGRCAIVPDDIPEAINTKHLCCITLNHEKCIPEFLHAAFLYHPGVARQLGVRAKGAVMPGLNMGIIKDLEVPVPPIELQEKFKRLRAVIELTRLDLESSLTTIQDLFDALQQLAFRGELDLSRFILDQEWEALHATAFETSAVKASKPDDAVQLLQVPGTTESELKKLDGIVSKGEPIQWSADYFKYRIIGRQQTPFSFGDVMQKAESVFEDPPPYDEIKDMILAMLGKDGKPALLTQNFDAGTLDYPGRNEILLKLLP